jgi:hypothetical protein
MALPIVMAFIVMMSITAVMLIRSNTQELPVAFKNLKHLQMKYIAKGAFQHARLKMSLLSTQAYDAAAYAVGKNPYYDHSSGYDGLIAGTLGPNQMSSRGVGNSGIVTNPGPAFLSGSVNSVNPLNRADVHNVPNSDDEWFGVPAGEDDLFDGGPTLRFKTNLGLVRFMEDISSLDPLKIPANWNGDLALPTSPPYRNPLGVWPGSQGAVRIVSSPAGRANILNVGTGPVAPALVDPITGKPDLFSASYHIKEMRVLASQGSSLYGTEAVSVKVNVRLYRKGASSTTDSPEYTAAYTPITNINASHMENVSGELEETAIFKVQRKL